MYIWEEEGKGIPASCLAQRIFGLGLGNTVYYVESSCRNPVVNRDTISTLRELAQKSGFWDSLQAVQMAEWIIGLVEDAPSRDSIHNDGRAKIDSFKITVWKGGLRGCVYVV